MPKFLVTVERTFQDYEYVDIEVEAPSADIAKDKAVELATNDPSEFEWRAGELGDSTYSAWEVTEV